MAEAELALMDAVAECDIAAVRDCLARGADPNYTAFRDEDEPNGFLQPTTPLRMVMFRISDSLLDDDGLRRCAEIARLLLEAGADPGPALAIAEWRYGKYDPGAPSNPFMDVWHLVARWRPTSQSGP